MEFSWQHVTSHARVPNGCYATKSFDQHSVGWCGCCYVVAVVQVVEDRGHVALPKTSRHVVDMQTVVNHFNTSHKLHDGTWNACHGGYPMHVVECLISGACPLITTQRKRWLGHPVRTSNTPLSTAPFSIASVERRSTEHIQQEIRDNGPVVLEISAQTLKSTDARGVVTDLTAQDPNHAVAVVGWKQTHAGPAWIVRNSWGRNRVPSALPDDVSCVNEDGNNCEVQWEYWVGDPHVPGFCYLPMSYPPLHTSDPWIVPRVKLSK
jgi:hypothetical protein